MIFTRTGPRLLFLRSNKYKQLEDYLVNSLEGQSFSLNKAFEESSENTTIAFITLPGIEKTRVEDALSIILLQDNSLNILTRLINDGPLDLAEKVQLGPGVLYMRIPEGGEKIIQRISEEYKADYFTYYAAIDKGEAGDTMISFTNKSLNRFFLLEKAWERSILLVNQPIAEVQRNIRRDAVRYITESMENTQWCELKINIYDGDGHYMKQVERLCLAFSDLEVGLILGETWTRDQAFMLFSVVAYQIRLFTLLPPEEIKKLLKGLEYNKDGKRFVDMDLYHRNKKIEFALLDENIRRQGKVKTGMFMRNEIFSKLSQDTSDKILKIEEEIRLANLEDSRRRT